jgi:hypothetical protein
MLAFVIIIHRNWKYLCSVFSKCQSLISDTNGLLHQESMRVQASGELVGSSSAADVSRHVSVCTLEVGTRVDA